MNTGNNLPGSFWQLRKVSSPSRSREYLQIWQHAFEKKHRASMTEHTSKWVYYSEEIFDFEIQPQFK
jgi:hypothetical protein